MRAALVSVLLALSAAAQPAEPLDVLADRLGGRDRFDALDSVRVVSRAELLVGERTLQSRSTLALRLPDAAQWDTSLGGRRRVVRLDGARASADGIALPDSAGSALRATLWLDPLVLLAGRRELRADWLSETLVQVDVPGEGDAILVGLDAAGRPGRLTTFRDREGRREYVAIQFTDYRDVEGLMLPHRAVQTVAGVKTGTTVVERIDLNPGGEAVGSGRD